MNKLTLEKFIEKSKKIHGDKYDYSLIITFENNKSKIDIICPIHGIFKQRLSSHFTYGCSKCSFDELKTKPEDFFIKVNKKYNSFFSYNENSFVDMNTPMKIICPIHGEFLQKPSNHLYRKGCKKCKNEKIGNLKRNKLDYFINQSNIVHNSFFDYTNVIYIDNKTKVKINCPTHGIFKQRPDDHIRGIGCPICNESKGEKQLRIILKKYNIEFEIQKIFKNCKNVRTLPFDFYLPEKNICIEYDGEQHFKENTFWGGKDAFKKQQIRDKIKTDYCKENNIHLLRIRYDENILEKLNFILTL